MNFISDITKEYIKDIVGQAIFYYPISELKTKTHEIYNEAVEKIFDNPIKIDAHVGQPTQSNKTGKIGYDQSWTLEVFIQERDMLDKGIFISIGDFFTYGTVAYEIVAANFIRNIYGQTEHVDGIKIIGQNVRESQFKPSILLGPTSPRYTDEDAVQTKFVQQRGFESNDEGPTADVRNLQKITDKPLTGPAEVSKKGDESDIGSSFYGDE